MEQTISLFLRIALIYIVLGIIFGAAFLLFGINKVDEDAKGTSRYFKAIIFPGVILLWPILLLKWMKS